MKINYYSIKFHFYCILDYFQFNFIHSHSHSTMNEKTGFKLIQKNIYMIFYLFWIYLIWLCFSHKFYSCNCSAKPPPPIKVVLIGPDSYVNSVLRCYVDQFSSKPPDWKNHLKFYIVPLIGNPNTTNISMGIGGSSNHTLARYLGTKVFFIDLELEKSRISEIDIFLF